MNEPNEYSGTIEVSVPGAPNLANFQRSWTATMFPWTPDQLARLTVGCTVARIANSNNPQRERTRIVVDRVSLLGFRVHFTTEAGERAYCDIEECDPRTVKSPTVSQLRAMASAKKLGAFVAIMDDAEHGCGLKVDDLWTIRTQGMRGLDQRRAMGILIAALPQGRG